MHQIRIFWFDAFFVEKNLFINPHKLFQRKRTYVVKSGRNNYRGDESDKSKRIEKEVRKHLNEVRPVNDENGITVKEEITKPMKIEEVTTTETATSVEVDMEAATN